MRVFEELEMEFFEPMDELPMLGEKVLVILKTGVSPNILRYCNFITYNTVPPKFEEPEKYGRKFTIGQVRCWGRLKKN